MAQDETAVQHRLQWTSHRANRLPPFPSRADPQWEPQKPNKFLKSSDVSLIFMMRK